MSAAQTERQPFFSVILPVYNQPKLVLRALTSLQAQDFQDWECWIVDDGSTDATPAVVQRWIQQEPRCRFLSLSQNQGAAAARNQGIAMAQGTFVTFLDADDWYHPAHLQRRWLYAHLYPATMCFYGGVQVIGDPYVPDVRNPRRKIHVHHCIIGATFVIRRSLLCDIGGFPEVRYGEDYFLFHRLRRRGITPYPIPHATYVYDRTYSRTTRMR